MAISFHFSDLFFDVNIHNLGIFPLSIFKDEAFGELAHVLHGEEFKAEGVEGFLFFDFFEVGKHFFECDFDIFLQLLKLLFF